MLLATRGPSLAFEGHSWPLKKPVSSYRKLIWLKKISIITYVAPIHLQVISLMTQLPRVGFFVGDGGKREGSYFEEKKNFLWMCFSSSGILWKQERKQEHRKTEIWEKERKTRITNWRTTTCKALEEASMTCFHLRSVNPGLLQPINPSVG